MPNICGPAVPTPVAPRRPEDNTIVGRVRATNAREDAGQDLEAPGLISLAHPRAPATPMRATTAQVGRRGRARAPAAIAGRLTQFGDGVEGDLNHRDCIDHRLDEARVVEPHGARGHRTVRASVEAARKFVEPSVLDGRDGPRRQLRQLSDCLRRQAFRGPATAAPHRPRSWYRPHVPGELVLVSIADVVGLAVALKVLPVLCRDILLPQYMAPHADVKRGGAELMVLAALNVRPPPAPYW